MSQEDKGAYFRALKQANVPLTKNYRNYTEAELKEAYDALAAAGQAPPLDYSTAKQSSAPAKPSVPVAPKDPNEMAGQRLNTKAPDDPIRTDEQGRIWYQEEVLKPAFAKPRGRRVLKYTDPGVREQSAVDGEFTETFEVAGNRQVASEVKITLPSYQVGIYKDQRFPFKIVTYNGVNGFDLFEVEDYYGGAELVPEEVKRMYVSNVLCYDIRTTIRAIESEFRRLTLNPELQKTGRS